MFDACPCHPSALDTELIVGDTNLNSGLSKTRIEALTDGIFAIAMTLMVFDIKVSPLAHMNRLNLQHELIQLWPRFLAYVISFIMLGVYWVGHHNQYHYIRRTDRPFLWINIFFLMGVSLIPFSTGLLGQFPEDRAALAVYGLNLIMVGGFLTLPGHTRRATTDSSRAICIRKWSGWPNIESRWVRLLRSWQYVFPLSAVDGAW